MKHSKLPNFKTFPVYKGFIPHYQSNAFGTKNIKKPNSYNFKCFFKRRKSVDCGFVVIYFHMLSNICCTRDSGTYQFVIKSFLDKHLQLSKMQLSSGDRDIHFGLWLYLFSNGDEDLILV